MLVRISESISTESKVTKLHSVCRLVGAESPSATQITTCQSSEECLKSSRPRFHIRHSEVSITIKKHARKIVTTKWSSTLGTAVPNIADVPPKCNTCNLAQFSFPASSHHASFYNRPINLHTFYYFYYPTRCFKRTTSSLYYYICSSWKCQGQLAKQAYNTDNNCLKEISPQLYMSWSASLSLKGFDNFELLVINALIIKQFHSVNICKKVRF